VDCAAVHRARVREHLADFPQQTKPAFAESGWRRSSSTTSTSDPERHGVQPDGLVAAQPLSRWAKMLMLIQSAISLVLAAMVVASAVNILR
jgi:hypothetical protein